MHVDEFRSIQRSVAVQRGKETWNSYDSSDLECKCNGWSTHGRVAYVLGETHTIILRPDLFGLAVFSSQVLALLLQRYSSCHSRCTDILTNILKICFSALYVRLSRCDLFLYRVSDALVSRIYYFIQRFIHPPEDRSKQIHRIITHAKQFHFSDWLLHKCYKLINLWTPGDVLRKLLVTLLILSVLV